MAHAYLCTLCDHLLSNHGSDQAGQADAVYRCAHCACERSAKGDQIGLSRSEFEEYMARPDTPPNIWAEPPVSGREA